MQRLSEDFWKVKKVEKVEKEPMDDGFGIGEVIEITEMISSAVGTSGVNFWAVNECYDVLVYEFNIFTGKHTDVLGVLSIRKFDPDKSDGYTHRCRWDFSGESICTNNLESTLMTMINKRWREYRDSI